MSINVVDLICCPDCQGDLVEEGKKLTCKNCKAEFREKDGVLILISKELERELRGFD